MGDITIENTNEGKRQPFKPPRPADANPSAQGTVKILIPKTKDDVRDVFVSYNFTPFLLKRGVPVEVPVGLAKGLETTTETKYFKEIDPVTQREVLVAQETQTVPFQYV